MNKLFKGVLPVTNNKDDYIKKSIIDHLSNSVKQIQYANIEENKSVKSEELTEAAMALCTSIEAMFLHCLKDTLPLRFRKVIRDIDQKPTPSFWSPLLVISHRQIIDQITNLSQISSEVGQCRAWVRLALNDCLLSSYIMTLRQDVSSLKHYYKTTAFARDCELLDVAQRLIEGVEAFKTFTLPFNSSLLNVWPLPSLILAGIWAPTLKACPVASCTDVAQTLTDSTNTQASFPETNSETASLSSAMSIASQSSSLRQIVALTEDEVLKIILSKNKNKDENVSAQYVDDVKSSCSSEPEKSSEIDINYTLGNSLNRRTGWSFDENLETTNVESSEDADLKKDENAESKGIDVSYNALIESYNILSGSYIKTPDIREIWQKFEDGRNKKDDSPTMSVQSVISPVQVTKSESTALTVNVEKISKEKGLDSQNYECGECKQSLGLGQKINVCAFTSEYFCDNCMHDEELPIPARIIHNWDFKSYPISQKAYNFLNEVKDHPIIDFKVLNPYIYGVIQEMSRLQTLRNQLNFLRAYLYTCREPIIEQLQKMMWPREYMYEHIHQYSILDLTEINDGILAQQLEKVVAFGKDHVFNCWLCSQKGFVCEICNNPKALFPFDVESVFRCEFCNGVYHKTCLNSSKPCPKCERKKQREELPLFSAVALE